MQTDADIARRHMQLGAAYAGCARFEEALSEFERALAHAPDEPRALQFVAQLQLQLGRGAEALASFRRALAREPLVTLPARRAPPAFRALLLFGPGAGNTPFEYLVEDADFDCHILTLVPEAPIDAAALRGRADLVVNLVADADLARDLLGPAADLAARLSLPLVNAPARIADTGRERIAERLSGTADCVVARTRRIARAGLANPRFDPARYGFSWPLLVRPAGTHGGDAFERVAAPGELERHLARVPAQEWYASEFLDCASADGYVRKYRFMCVGEQILPYHLAIGSHWKVHHATTDMADNAWMQREEREFLAAPERVFDAPARAALERIRRTIGLDYFGIDCALDRAGRVVVFEANACMLVHGRNERFPYKDGAVRRIRAAFQALLGERAGVAPAR
jgi:glutathione synthase/RimK-type ligase-like ATP-grasp enzyme